MTSVNKLSPFGKYLPLAIVVVACLLAYSNSFDGQYVMDDGNNIYQNTSIRNFADSFTPPESVNIFRRQVVNVSLAVNYAISGYDVWSYHVVNLLIHLTGALLLFGIIRRLLSSSEISEKYGEKSAWIAVAGATLWAVHPLQTQAVTYIIQRCESLLGMCVLLSLYLAVRSMEASKPWPWRIGALVTCLVGVGVKESIILTPVLVLFYDRYFMSGTVKQSLVKHRPLYLGYLVCMALFVINLSAYVSSEKTVQEFSALAYAMAQPEVILHYLSLVVWPLTLCLDYQWKVPEFLPALPSILAVLCMIGGTVWLIIKRNPYGFFLGWFWIALAPSSSFIPINDLAFEHRMYLPLAGLAGVAALGLFDIFRLLNRWGGKAALLVVAGLWVGVVGACIGLTIERNSDYAKGEFFMWQDVLAKRPGNVKAISLVGKGLAQQGKFEEAVVFYKQGLERSPDSIPLHNDLAIIYQASGDLSNAEEHFRRMIQIKPDIPLPYLGLGKMLLQAGEVREAVMLLEKAVELNPGLVAVRAKLAQIYVQAGLRSKAIPHLEAYLAKNPDNQAAKRMLDRIR